MDYKLCVVLELVGLLQSYGVRRECLSHCNFNIKCMICIGKLFDFFEVTLRAFPKVMLGLPVSEDNRIIFA